MQVPSKLYLGFVFSQGPGVASQMHIDSPLTYRMLIMLDTPEHFAHLEPFEALCQAALDLKLKSIHDTTN